MTYDADIFVDDGSRDGRRWAHINHHDPASFVEMLNFETADLVANGHTKFRIEVTAS